MLLEEQDSPEQLKTHFVTFRLSGNLDGDSAPHTLGLAHPTDMQILAPLTQSQGEESTMSLP